MRPGFTTTAGGNVTGCIDQNTGQSISPAYCCNKYPDFAPNFCNHISELGNLNRPVDPNSSQGLGSTQKAKVLLTTIGRKLGLSRSARNQVGKLLPNRIEMLIYLKNSGVPVSNPSNIYEVLVKYAAVHPGIVISADLYNQLNQAISKKGSEGFDFSSIFSAIGGIVDGITNAVNQGENQKKMNEFIVEVLGFMKTDFGDIEQILTGNITNPGLTSYKPGPVGALQYLKKLKTTSWVEIKNHIQHFSQTSGLPIPAEFQNFWDAQAALEIDLQNQVDRMSGSGSGRTDGNGSGSGRGTGSGPGTGPGNGQNANTMGLGNIGDLFMQYWPILAIIVVILFFMKKK